MNLFLVLVEEADLDDIRREIQVFSSIDDCYMYLLGKVAIYKTYEWATSTPPPDLSPISKIKSLHENILEIIYSFEHQHHRDFFSINIFIKITRL
jgi:hypothetical protein